MGQSEAREVTYTSPREPKSDAEHQANLQEIARQKQAREELTVYVFGLPGTAKPKKDPRKAFIATLDGLSEKDYCQSMHDAGYQTPATWQAWGCPPDYLDAHGLKKKMLRNHFLRLVRSSERKNARRSLKR